MEKCAYAAALLCCTSSVSGGFARSQACEENRCRRFSLLGLMAIDQVLAQSFTLDALEGLH